MRKSLILIVLFGFAVQNPPRVEAGAFATEVTQLLNHAQLIMQYIRQGEQLANEINMYADMVKNSRTLSAHNFGAIMNDINALANIVQGGRALAYSLGNLDQQFRQTYPGYGYNAGAYYGQYRNWSQTSLDTTLGTLRAAGLQGRQLQSEQAILLALRQMATSADGRMQAIEVGNQISEQAVEQLMKLRQLMLADLQSKQAFQAAQIQKEARNHAATEQFFNYVAPASDGRTFGGGSR